MKATLTIEVSDDFEKGSCYGCPFHLITFMYPVEYCDLNYSPENCPLEIQGEKKDYNFYNTGFVRRITNDNR